MRLDEIGVRQEEGESEGEGERGRRGWVSLLGRGV